MMSEVNPSPPAAPYTGPRTTLRESIFPQELTNPLDQMPALEQQCRQLQILVSELLQKNQALRIQLARAHYAASE